MAREDVRERPRPGKSGGLAGMLNVRQEAFQAVEVVVGLLEQIAERVNPPDRTESFMKQAAGRVELIDVGSDQLAAASVTLTIAEPSASAIVRRVVAQVPLSDPALGIQQGGAWVFVGDSPQGVPLEIIEWQEAGAGFPGTFGVASIPEGIQANQLHAVFLIGGVEAEGWPVRLIAFGELPGRDDS